jgi:hypothetical protein
MNFSEFCNRSSDYAKPEKELEFRAKLLGEWVAHDSTTCRTPKCEACRHKAKYAPKSGPKAKEK